MKVEMGNKYRTKDGRSVRILCVDRQNRDYPVVGLEATREGDSIETWTAEGFFSNSGGTSEMDLVGDKPEIKRFLNIYHPLVEGEDFELAMHSTREEADFNNADNRIACIPIIFKEGEGL